MVSNQKLLDKDTFNIWHERLGHPGSIMMRRIIKSATGYPLKKLKSFATTRLIMCSKFSGQTYNSALTN
ncbi:putative GAG-pre-integrase domain-containing protein [Helianthus anomalus]